METGMAYELTRRSMLQGTGVLAMGAALGRSAQAAGYPDRPVKMIARAKSKPNELSYAHAGLGTTPHLAGELLKIIEGVSMTPVPYQGGGPAVQAVLGGTVPVGCASLPGAHPSIKGGALRALAV